MAELPEQKRVPVRQCAGCCGRFPKSGLIRLIKNAEGTVQADFPQTAQCRGIYVCRSAPCLARAVKSGRIYRQLGCRADAAALAEELGLSPKNHGNTH